MSFWGNDTVMAYSDYCKMRKQLGYEKIDLKKGHFIVQGVSGVKTVLDKEQPKFQIEGETLSYQACYTEGFALEGDLGAYLILVLPDEYAEKLDIYEAVYVADTEGKTGLCLRLFLFLCFILRSFFAVQHLPCWQFNN